MLRPDNHIGINGTGIGLRGPHVPQILNQLPDVAWFELLTDNHLASGGSLRFQAEAIAERYPVALHGVGMSLGGIDPLDQGYIDAVKALAQRIDAVHVSEHLAFTAHRSCNSHDLLPLPWSEEVLNHVVARIDVVQNELGEPILIENISAYIEYEYNYSEMNEAAFLDALCRRTGCGLLLDINNVYVNSVNHGYDALQRLQDMPWWAVKEIHLAGHHECDGLLIDSHGAPVCAEVLELFCATIRNASDTPVLLEWDTKLPEWEVLLAESQRLETARQTALEHQAA